MKKLKTQNRALFFEDYKATLQETERIFKEKTAEFDQRFEKSRKEQERLTKENTKGFEEIKLLFKESDARYEKRMKNMENEMGGWANTHGSFAEEYFFNSFENGKQNFFGEEFDEIDKNFKSRKDKLQDEYDIVMFNHSSIAIVEVKFTVREKDIPKTLKKAETFKILFPEYKDFKIYLGLASLNFCKEMEEECIRKGIAVIKQVGEMVIIQDEHLKVF
jgi:hypothetical protein